MLQSWSGSQAIKQTLFFKAEFPDNTISHTALLATVGSPMIFASNKRLSTEKPFIATCSSVKQGSSSCLSPHNWNSQSLVSWATGVDKPLVACTSLIATSKILIYLSPLSLCIFTIKTVISTLDFQHWGSGYSPQ